MKIFDAEQVRHGLPWLGLVEALRSIFAGGSGQPLRGHHAVGHGDLLVMPAFADGGHFGVKLVTVFRGNAALGLPVVSGLYLLFDGETGVPIAQIDGGMLTNRRTAAASVLAATFLARPDSRVLAVLGTGKISLALAEAYCAVFPIETVTICGRDPERSRAAAASLKGLAAHVGAAASPEAAMAKADIVASATIASEPLILGRHLRPGMHVDLVGAYRPDMRESDDDVMARADGIFVDTREGALHEAGDILQAIAAGVITDGSIAADLTQLCRGEHPGRRSRDDITVFKSVGASCEDIAAARLLYGSAATG